jgi:hypothetical protein
LVKNYGAPRRPFARLYTPVDVALVVEVDRAMGTLSGPATACVLGAVASFDDCLFAVSVGPLRRSD